MRGLFLGGLGLALGCLVSQAQGQEIQWRPAGPRPAAAANAGPGAAAVRLGRPTTGPAAEATVTDPLFRPAAFAPEAPAVPGLVFRAAAADVQKPLPSGPALTGPGGGEPEPLPMPRPSGAVPTPGTGPSDFWGGSMMPWGAAGPVAAGPVVGNGVVLNGGPGLPGCDAGDCCGGDCCGGDCCGGCCGAFCKDGRCPMPGRVWASAEYLLWGLRSPNLPPLVTTTGNLTGAELLALRTVNPAFNPGALGQPGTQILVGGSPDLGAFNGGRFTVGFAPWDQLGFEATYFFLGSNTVNNSSGSTGFPGIYRPFFNVNTGANDAEFVAFPGVVSGNVTTSYKTSLWGAEANARYPLLCGCNYKLDLIGGFRYIDLGDTLNINESVTFLASNPALGVAAGDNIRVSDSFLTENHFYGGQVGGDFEWRQNRWIFGVTAKVGVGTMHEVINIDGSTTFTTATGTKTVVGGLLAQQSNSGHFSQDRFAVVPEGALKIGYQLTDHLTAFASYNFMYISDVVRAADQVDLSVNTTQLPSVTGPGTLVGAARPAVPFRTTDFWAQGFTVGLQYAW